MTNRQYQFGRSTPAKRLSGFTLVEMLIAMTIALLMMAALARSFAFVGESVRDSRANIRLTDVMRGVTTRLSDDFDHLTRDLDPLNQNADELGYLTYYEGPMTDATSSIFRAVAVDGEQFSRDARYGDLDDYLAFTAVANGDDWFVGKVPRYILDQKTATLAGTPYSVPTFTADPVAHVAAFEPVMIRSKYAEIIYFASPEYTESSLAGTPAVVDVLGDEDPISATVTANGLPDRIKLHRRVLLIRPDLNIGGVLPVQVRGDGTLSLSFMQADTWPTSAGVDSWLHGMAAVHQQCDLSVRRVLDASGLPTISVAANSLDDLTLPHNRFAAVRVPNYALIGSGSANSPTSMPVLALGDPLGIFSAVTSVGPPVSLAPPATPNVGPVVTPSSLCGFVSPEFVLGLDRKHVDIPGDAWGSARRGEDIILDGVLGFDVKVYDPDVINVDTSKFDTQATNLLITPSDAGYRESYKQAIAQLVTWNGTTGNPVRTLQHYAQVGGFVDLCYPVLAGGSMRGWQPRRLDRLQTADNTLVPATAAGLQTPFSGVQRYLTTSTSLDAYSGGLYRSGRLIVLGSTIRLFQPSFDTFTDYYERDGFQQFNLPSGQGSVWTTTTSGLLDGGANGIDDDTIFGADDIGERETLPPFIDRPQAVSVTIRSEDASVRVLHQQTVVHRDL